MVCVSFGISPDGWLFEAQGKGTAKAASSPRTSKTGCKTDDWRGALPIG